MKCKVCRGPAIVKFPAHNANFCTQHFDEFFIRQVEKAIRRYNLLKRGEKVLVAVSGGKDSLVTVDVLSRLGYPVRGLHVDLGIGDNGFSTESIECCQQFFRARSLPLEIFSLQDKFGKNIKDAGKKFDRFCSICGMTKRYVMNYGAWIHKVDALATGHNLDDLSAALFANLMRWDVRYLAKGSPYLPPEGKFSRKIKPLALLTEKEIATYAEIHAIKVVSAICPYSQAAKFKRYKNLLAAVEEPSPGTKRSFYAGYLKNIDLFQQHADAAPSLNPCHSCGMPTTVKVCSFCKIWRDEN